MMKKKWFSALLSLILLLGSAVGAIEPAIVVITGALAGVILLSVMRPLMGLLSTIG